MQLLASVVKSQNQSKQQSFQVIPNPAFDEVNITLNQTHHLAYQFYITDVNGKNISLENVQQHIENGNIFITIHTSDLSYGLYFIN